MSKFAEISLIIAIGICMEIAGFMLGIKSVVSKLHEAVDNNETLKEFYYSNYPDNYKKYYADWNTLN